MDQLNFKTAFVHGRPGPHPFHGVLASSVNADFHFVDLPFRWHDVEGGKLKRYFSWFAFGFFFPNRKNYDIFLSEGLHVPPFLMKKMGLLKRSQKIVALLANESLYFLKTRKYPSSAHKLLSKLLRGYDALICIGEFQYELARELLTDVPNKPDIYYVPSSIAPALRVRIEGVNPNLTGDKIVFIGSGPAEWRAWYKGLDILLESISLVISRGKFVQLNVVGNWNEQYINEMIKKYPNLINHVKFLGFVSNLREVLEDAALYVHPARGEAFGISILEAMYAGVPCLVSQWTGAKEAVAQVSPDYVSSLDVETIADKVINYFELPLEAKKKLSEKSKVVADSFHESVACEKFQKVMSEINYL